VATVVDRYVDTAAAAGGNGTTAALSGANCAYQSLNAALTAEAKDLVTPNLQLTIHCNASSGAADTVNTAAFSASWVTDATHFIEITVDAGNRHAGVYDTTKYRIENFALQTFLNPPGYTRLFWLQALNRADDNNLEVFGFRNGTGAQGCQVAHCIGRYEQKARTYGGTPVLFFSGTDQTAANILVWDNLFYDVCTGLNKGAVGISGVNANIVAYNNTIVRGGIYADSTSVGISDGYSRVKSVNNLVQGFNTFNNPHAAGTDYNATDCAAASGAAGATHDRAAQTFTFVDTTKGKYQLAGTDAGAKGFGTNLSADATLPFSDDIVGAARSDPWDIGAFIAATATAAGAPISWLFGRQAVPRAATW